MFCPGCTHHTHSYCVRGPCNMSSTSEGSGEALSTTNLYIRGLLASTTDADLYNMCKQYGKVISTKAIMDKHSGTCKGYGFVDFDCSEEASAAAKALIAQGVQAQMAKKQEQDPTNLYFANLPSFVGEAELEGILKCYGPIISTRILRDPLGNSRGVGFARLESKDKCDKAIEQYNGKNIYGEKEPLLVKFADGKTRKKTCMALRREGEGFLQPALCGDYHHANALTPIALPHLPRYGLAMPSASVGTSPTSSWLQNPCLNLQGNYQQLPVVPVTTEAVQPLHNSSVIAQLSHLNQVPLGGSYLPSSYGYQYLIPQQDSTIQLC